MIHALSIPAIARPKRTASSYLLTSRGVVQLIVVCAFIAWSSP